MSVTPVKPMTPDPYAQFCGAILALTGVDLSKYKRGQMERRVTSFARSAKCGCLSDYQSLLEQDDEARAQFLDRLTINVSQLWRNPDQWSILETTVLPELLRAGRLAALCAGVSYGAEAYTLAALCADLHRGRAEIDILGTDIDARMIARANHGVFSDSDARDAPLKPLKRHFERVEDGWSPRRALRDQVRFEVSDLLTQRFEPESLDLVLCRNTVIYFEAGTRDAVHRELARALRPGGRLVVGATEHVFTPHRLSLITEAPFVYRRV